MILHRLVEHAIEGPDDLRARSARSPTTATRCRSSSSRRRVPRPRRRDRDVRRPQHHRAVELLASPIYHGSAPLQEARRPASARRRSPSVGKESVVAETFDLLRDRVLDAAKQGIQVSRFKGLGEMNAEQLWETTMDPAKRLLDARRRRGRVRRRPAFSMLMGDQVEPRRSSSSRTRRTSSSWMSEGRMLS